MSRSMFASFLFVAGLVAVFTGTAFAESGATQPPAKSPGESAAKKDPAKKDEAKKDPAKKIETGSKGIEVTSPGSKATPSTGHDAAKAPGAGAGTHAPHAGAAKATASAAETAATPPATLEPPAPVYCGSFTPFRFRITAVGKDPSTRANFAMDIINKYLGGRMGKVTTQPAGKNTRLLLNNELLAVITPADALVEHLKTSDALATKWARLLTTAFEASKAQR